MSLMRGKRGSAPQGRPSEMFESEWKKMEVAFERLLQFVASGYKKPPDHDLWIRQNMEAYACVYNMCTRLEGPKHATFNSAELIYERTKNLIEKYLSTCVTQSVANKKGDELLTKVYTHWDHHQLMVRWGRFQFRYLDDYYTKQHQVDPLRIMMLKCFNSAVYDRIKVDLREVLLTEIQKERDGTEIKRTVTKEAIWLFVEMGMDTLAIYEADFEHFYVERTMEFYKLAAATWLNERGGNHTYLLRVEKSLTEEKVRAGHYLHPSSLQKVIGTVEHELLSAYQMQVLEDADAGTEALLIHSKNEDLARMYALFKRIPNGLEPLANILRDYIKSEGKAVNARFCSGELEGNPYIEQCIELHEKYTALFQECFENDTICHKARKEAFEVFINETLQPAKPEHAPRVTTSELLSNFCDNVMKNEKITPDDLEVLLGRIVALFAHISDKDLFQEFYRKQMSRRLLVNKTDNDNERQLISKLKMRMGAPYTSKLEGMIVDKGLSKETCATFQQFCKDHDDMELRIDFSAQVLTTGFWPAFKTDALNLPPELDINLQHFKRFYDKTTQSRLLKWVHSLGTATISARFPKGQKEIIVSTYQVCLLLPLNTQETLVCGDIGKDLGLPVEEVKRTLHSLAFGKFPLLRKAQPPADKAKPKQISEDDAFIVNEDFACPQRKFKIPNVIKTAGDPVETTDENRRHVVEACVVRIMKSRKRLNHLDLQTMCISQLSTFFKPDPKMIKKRVEDLIQRGYLERDEADRNIYRYLA